MTLEASAAASTAASGSPQIEAALRAAAALTGMELVFLAGVGPELFTWQALHGSWPGITVGETLPRADSFCAAMLGGAPPITSDAARDPAYALSAFRSRYGVTSYVGVPVVTPAGVVGTLCAIDRRSVAVDAAVLAVMRGLADVVSEALTGGPTVRVTRTASGWRVDDGGRSAGLPNEGDELPVALSLADLCVDDLEPPLRPQRTDATQDETELLRVQVRQLEHALAARVLIEQAIGTLAERWSVPPRDAFERLRRLARAQGMRVHVLAKSVVTSTHEAVPNLPVELR